MSRGRENRWRLKPHTAAERETGADRSRVCLIAWATY